ncbi:MAG: transglutaminase [Gallionellales bacterium RBG_16_56_9]|nr:MAG: transglutaminase [Gallionellales bacterium RBG_16_56_9]
MIDALDYFTSLVQQDDSIPLFEAAVSIAQGTSPQLDLLAAQLEVDAFAERLRRRLQADASDLQKIRLLNHLFYRELGFGPNLNHFFDPDNSYLDRVIATRRGIPISLAVIYMELAQQIGLQFRGVCFPGHFLLKVPLPAGAVVLDPMSGASLSQAELEERLAPYWEQQPALAQKPVSAFLRAATAREILVRMLHNLKTIFLENQQWQALLEVQQRLVILLPDDIIERRDRGSTYATLECPQAALQDLEAYLQKRPNAADATDIRARLPQLRAASQRLN